MHIIVYLYNLPFTPCLILFCIVEPKFYHVHAKYSVTGAQNFEHVS